MANSTLPEEDRADIPGIRQKESLSSNTAGGKSWGAGNSTGGGGGGASSSTGSGFYNSTGDIKDVEESANDKSEDQLGKGYTGSSNSIGKHRVRFRITKRRAIVGVGTSTLVGVAFSFFSFSSGPLQFIHIAQLLDRFHFSAQQDAEDGRLTRIARYINDPSKPQNTRLGIVGNAIADKIETKMRNSTGLTSDYNTTSGRFLGYTVDRNHSDYKGLGDNEIKDKLSSKYGVDRSSITVSGGKVSFSPKTSRNPITAYRQQTQFSRAVLKEAGLSKVSSYAGSRVLGTRAGWTFHPIQALDATVQARLLEGGKAAVDKIKEQFRKDIVQYDTKGVTPEAVKARSGTDNPDGTTTPGGPGTDEAATKTENLATDTTKAAQDLNNGTGNTADVKSKLSAKAITGGAAGVAGLLCIVKGLGDHIDQAKYDKAMLPMMRMASQAVSVGSQAQSGQGITALQLGFYEDFLVAKNPDGTTASTWNQAQSIQVEMGHPQSGIDIPRSGQVFNGNPVSDIIGQVPALGSICSALSSPLGIVIGWISAPVSSLVAPKVINEASSLAAGWLTGAPVDPLSAGADYGNFINYGARLSANDQYASAGGAPMSSSDEVALKVSNDGLDQVDFHSKNIAYRLFNTHDSRSLASKLIDSQSGNLNNVASLSRGFASIFSNLLKIPATLLSGTSHAATQAYNYHGMKKVGFTAQELATDDERFANPFLNACYVVGCPSRNITGIFENADQEANYADKVQKCFGVQISGDANGWTTDGKTKAVDFTNSNFPSGCQDSGNSDWMHIRFWLLDTATIEGYDCSQGGTDTSDDSCNDIGFGGNTAPASGVATGAKGSNFNIASYNLLGASHTEPGGDTTQGHDRYGPRLDKAISIMKQNNFDIVGLQELESPQRKKLLNDAGDTYDIYPSTDIATNNFSENAIIWIKSKFSLVESGKTTIPYNATLNRDVPWVKLKDRTSGQEFYVFNTHDPVGENNKQYRPQDAKIHLADMEAKIKTGLPVFMTGDFNSAYEVRPQFDLKDRSLLTYCILTSTGDINDSIDAKNGKDGTCPSKSGGAIDHVYVSKDVNVGAWEHIVNSDTNAASDHDPVVTAVSIGGSDISAYKNPLRDVKNLVAKRIDQGVDYGGSGPVHPIGNGTIVNLKNDGWPGGAFIVYKLKDGPAAGKFVFFAENCPPVSSLNIGDAVTPDDVICNMIDADPHIETGWADGSGNPGSLGDALAHDVWGKSVDDTQHYTAYGQNFSQLLVKLGAPAGTKEAGSQKLGSLPSGWPAW